MLMVMMQQQCSWASKCKNLQDQDVLCSINHSSGFSFRNWKLFWKTVLQNLSETFFYSVLFWIPWAKMETIVWFFKLVHQETRSSANLNVEKSWCILDLFSRTGTQNADSEKSSVMSEVFLIMSLRSCEVVKCYITPWSWCWHPGPHPGAITNCLLRYTGFKK